MATNRQPHISEVLTVNEVARLFAVEPKTVTRWDVQGKLPAAFRTLGGHRRWRRADVEARLNGGQQ